MSQNFFSSKNHLIGMIFNFQIFSHCLRAPKYCWAGNSRRAINSLTKLGSCYNFYQKLHFNHLWLCYMLSIKTHFPCLNAWWLLGQLYTNYCVSSEFHRTRKSAKEIHRFHHLRINWAWFILQQNVLEISSPYFLSTS